MATFSENELCFINYIYDIIKRNKMPAQSPILGAEEIPRGWYTGPDQEFFYFFETTPMKTLLYIERDSRDVNQKMTDFRNQLLKAREYVEKMPGIQYSRQDQLKQIDILQQQLQTKTQLIQKYKSMENFDLATPMQQ